MIIPRDKYLQELKSVMHNGMIKIITGVRRCGKSYLLFELFKQSLLESGVNEEHIIQVDLENRRNKRLRNPDTLWRISSITNYESGDIRLMSARWR